MGREDDFYMNVLNLESKKNVWKEKKNSGGYFVVDFWIVDVAVVQSFGELKDFKLDFQAVGLGCQLVSPFECDGAVIFQNLADLVEPCRVHRQLGMVVSLIELVQLGAARFQTL